MQLVDTIRTNNEQQKVHGRSGRKSVGNPDMRVYGAKHGKTLRVNRGKTCAGRWSCFVPTHIRPKWVCLGCTCRLLVIGKMLCVDSMLCKVIVQRLFSTACRGYLNENMQQMGSINMHFVSCGMP